MTNRRGFGLQSPCEAVEPCGMMVRNSALAAVDPGMNPGSIIKKLYDLGTLFSLSGPQFHHLINGVTIQ